jgi:hypothetical protein
MGHERDGYETNGHEVEENIKEEIWTGGRARRIRTNQEMRELYNYLDMVADNYREQLGISWACSKNGSSKDS